MSDKMTLTKLHIQVLRACYAHGEDGDWDMGAVKRFLIECDGMTETEAQEALDVCEAAGVLVIDHPTNADVIPFAPTK